MSSPVTVTLAHTALSELPAWSSQYVLMYFVPVSHLYSMRHGSDRFMVHVLVKIEQMEKGSSPEIVIEC